MSDTHHPMHDDVSTGNRNFISYIYICIYIIIYRIIYIYI